MCHPSIGFPSTEIFFSKVLSIFTTAGKKSILDSLSAVVNSPLFTF
jgi:hypothetical protein